MCKPMHALRVHRQRFRRILQVAVQDKRVCRWRQRVLVWVSRRAGIWVAGRRAYGTMVGPGGLFGNDIDRMT